MARTHFAQFTLEGGRSIEVEYSTTAGEPDFDCPGHICDGGGSGPEVEIVDCWPNDEAYQDLASSWSARSLKPSASGKKQSPWDRFVLWTLEVRMTWACWRRARLTIEEREGLEAALAESYVEPDDDLDYDYEPRGA